MQRRGGLDQVDEAVCHPRFPVVLSQVQFDALFGEALKVALCTDELPEERRHSIRAAGQHLAGILQQVPLKKVEKQSLD